MKRISIIIFTIIVSILMTCNVFASSSFQVGLTSDKTELKAGEIVNISISLTNLNVTTGEQGIGAYLAKIQYDTRIFEKPVLSGNANWEVSMENGNIVGVTADGSVVKQAETVATLSLTVKEDAPAGETTVTISNFVGSDAVNDIMTNNKSINIKVTEEDVVQNPEDSEKDETDNENNTNTGTNTTDKNNTNNNTSGSTNNNNNANNNNTGNNTNNGVTDNPNSNNDNNNTDSDINDNENSDDDINDDSNDNSNGGTSDAVTDNTIPEEQLPQEEDKTESYIFFIAIILALIIVIYICYRKTRRKNKLKEKN